MWISVIISSTSDFLNSVKKDFSAKSNLVEDIYNRQLALKKIAIKGVQKIAITLTSEQNINYVSAPIKGYAPVLTIRRSYDFKYFITLNENEQYKEILDVIQSCLILAADKMGYDGSLFEEVRSQVLATGFKQIYFEGPLKLSRDKKTVAGVEVEMNTNGATISIVFQDHNNEVIKKIPLIIVHPNRIFIKPLIGKYKWLNNSEFEVVDAGSEIHFIASLEKDRPTIVLSPISNTKDKLIDDLLIASVTTNREQIIEIIEERIRSAFKDSGDDTK